MMAAPISCDDAAADVVGVGPEAADDDSPGERAGDEDAAIGREDAAEVVVALGGGDEPVKSESDEAAGEISQTASFSGALPHKPGTADLGGASEDEQGDGA